MKFNNFIANLIILKNPSHFRADGPKMVSQMSYRALEPRTGSSRTRRFQIRQREGPQRAVSGSNGPVFGPKQFEKFSPRFRQASPLSSLAMKLAAAVACSLLVAVDGGALRKGQAAEKSLKAAKDSPRGAGR